MLNRLKICHPKDLKGSDTRLAGHFGDKRKFAVAGLVITAELPRSYVHLRHFKFQDRGCWFLFSPLHATLVSPVQIHSLTILHIYLSIAT